MQKLKTCGQPYATSQLQTYLIDHVYTSKNYKITISLHYIIFIHLKSPYIRNFFNDILRHFIPKEHNGTVCLTTMYTNCRPSKN